MPERERVVVGTRRQDVAVTVGDGRLYFGEARRL
jgi:hypothetical protein